MYSLKHHLRLQQHPSLPETKFPAKHREVMEALNCTLLNHRHYWKHGLMFQGSKELEDILAIITLTLARVGILIPS